MSTHTRADSIKAISLFLYVLFSLAVIIGIVRHISDNIHTFQIVLCYNVFGLIFFLPKILRVPLKEQKPKKFRLLATRAVLEFLAFSLSFYSLTLIPLPMHTALQFVTPIFATIIAISLLGERPSVTNLISIALGFVGVLIITRPGFMELDFGILVALLAALGFAMCGNTVKMLTRTESTYHIALYMLVMTSIIALPFALLNWATPTGEEWLWLALIGLLGLSQQIAIAVALMKVPYTTVLPMNFAQLVFVSIIAYVFFNELVDIWTLSGAAIIIGGALYNAYHTTRRPVPALTPQTEKA